MSEVRWTPEWTRLRWGSLGVGGVGLLCWLLGAWPAPRQAMFSYLTAFSFGLSIALGALMMVMIGHLTGARWFIPLRRPMEATAATLPVFAGLFIPILLGLDALFPWRAAEVVLEPWLQDFASVRRSYLSTPFFTLRAAIYFTVWIIASQLLYTWSIQQDGGRPELAARQRTLSAVGLPAVVFALTFAAFDWLMSLTPGWGSTVWGVYYFAGGFVAALGLLAVLGAGLERSGPLRGHLSASHSLALGRLLLAALLFWIYVAYSQYLVVWIGNLPSEVIWYLPRVKTSWGWVAVLLLAGHLALPGLALLSWRLKRTPARLALVGGWIVGFHYLDLYWMVLPALHPNGIRPHWLDLAALAAVAGIAVSFGARRLRGRPALPAGDPDLDAALEYTTR
jgi:hypothetical protein